MVNTRRFIVGPMLGYDFVWYRLALLPVDRTNVLLANIANNPAAYNPNIPSTIMNLHVAGAVITGCTVSKILQRISLWRTRRLSTSICAKANGGLMMAP
jgi:hypothetical protein